MGISPIAGEWHLISFAFAELRLGTYAPILQRRRQMLLGGRSFEEDLSSTQWRRNSRSWHPDMGDSASFELSITSFATRKLAIETGTPVSEAGHFREPALLCQRLGTLQLLSCVSFLYQLYMCPTVANAIQCDQGDVFVPSATVTPVGRKSSLKFFGTNSRIPMWNKQQTVSRGNRSRCF